MSNEIFDIYESCFIDIQQFTILNNDLIKTLTRDQYLIRLEGLKLIQNSKYTAWHCQHTVTNHLSFCTSLLFCRSGTCSLAGTSYLLAAHSSQPYLARPCTFNFLVITQCPRYRSSIQQPIIPPFSGLTCFLQQNKTYTLGVGKHGFVYRTYRNTLNQ